MSSAYALPIESPWQLSTRDQRRFDRIVLLMIAIFTVAGLIVPFLPVPEIERSKAEALPPRLAKLLIEKKEPPPPPPLQKTEQQEEAPKDKIDATEKNEEPLKADIETARKKASSSGLLALQGELAGLRQHSALTKLKSNRKLLTTGSAATAKRSIITSNATTGSGGINTSQLSRSVASTGLAGRNATRVDAPIPIGEAAPNPHGKNRLAARTIEDIQLVFDLNKGAIYSIYNRALRKDPSLKGKVVLSITIDPAGKVLACEIISNEVDSAEFAQKLVARVKLFDFGVRNVDTMVVTYPIEFLPS